MGMKNSPGHLKDKIAQKEKTIPCPVLFRLLKGRIPQRKIAKQLGRSVNPSPSHDNGLEFAAHQTLPSRTFLCDPYSSWQKGPVEHANSRIRKWLPKHYNGPITQQMLDNIAHIINNKPRKVLGCKTPAQIFNRCGSN
jgi:hypothetical protein